MPGLCGFAGALLGLPRFLPRHLLYDESADRDPSLSREVERYARKILTKRPGKITLIVEGESVLAGVPAYVDAQVDPKRAAN